jgi:hypothetical protein
MKLPIRGLLASACAFALIAPAASATDVTVRVEGADRTLQPTTAVTLPGPAVDKTAEGGTTCTTTSGGSALEAAVGGDWGGRSDQQGQRVERIRGVTHLLGGEYAGAYWSLYINDRPAPSGLCSITPQQGDEILLYPACGGSTSGCFAGEPLNLAAPATVRPGEPFSVQVHETKTTFNPNPPYDSSTTTSPSSGATVAGGGASATTGGDGRASLTLSQRGPVTLVATKGSFVREGVTVCVTDGADGACGSAVPGSSGTGSSGTPFVPDRIAPRAFFTSLRSRTYSRRNAPRLLKGKVDDAGGVRTVKLRLTRTTPGGRCFAFSGKREKFIRRPKCGASSGWWFAIGDRADWEYQLPAKLGPGRYVLDVNAIDKSYNRDDERRRGENRAVFTVR